MSFLKEKWGFLYHFLKIPGCTSNEPKLQSHNLPQGSARNNWVFPPVSAIVSVIQPAILTGAEKGISHSKLRFRPVWSILLSAIFQIAGNLKNYLSNSSNWRPQAQLTRPRYSYTEDSASEEFPCGVNYIRGMSNQYCQAKRFHMASNTLLFHRDGQRWPEEWCALTVKIVRTCENVKLSFLVSLRSLIISSCIFFVKVKRHNCGIQAFVFCPCLWKRRLRNTLITKLAIVTYVHYII